MDRRKKAHLKSAVSLQESEELLAVAQEAGGFGIFEWQVEKGTVHLSPKLQSLYGLTSFDDLYETWLGYIFGRTYCALGAALRTPLLLKNRE